MADKCDPIRSTLHALEAQLKDTDKFIQEPMPGEKHPPKPVINREWTNLNSRVANTRLSLRACEKSLRRWTVTGGAFLESFELDAAVKKFMIAHSIRAMSVAIARNGTLGGNRGYTWAEPNYPITQPDTLFRVASVSKIFTCAAIDRLVATGALAFTTQAFGFLGITSKLLSEQTPDRDIGTITVHDLATRQSGLGRDFGKDFRTIAIRLSQNVMPTRQQLVEYVYGEPLVVRPGTGDNYSNSAFTVLTSIVERASGAPSFIDYLRRQVLAPLGINDVWVGATAENMRRPKEVSSYDADGKSPSQIDMTVGVTANDAYGGTFALENGEGAGGLTMSTGTVARFLATHAVWDIGPRQTGTRYGDFAGTGAGAVSRDDGLGFAYAFNRWVDTPEHDVIAGQINAILDRHSRLRLVPEPVYRVMAKLAGLFRRWFFDH
jgi:CubicO group peptidase (beta-lactamase class C family)